MIERKEKQNDLGTLFLDVKQVAAMCNLGQSTIWKLSKQGKFPQPRAFGARCSRWKRSEVIAWANNL